MVSRSRRSFALIMRSTSFSMARITRVMVALTGTGIPAVAGLAHDGAVHDLDLRGPVLVEVLEHGRAVGPGLPRHVVDHGQGVVVGERDPPGPGHRHGLCHEVRHDRPRLLGVQRAGRWAGR